MSHEVTRLLEQFFSSKANVIASSITDILLAGQAPTPTPMAINLLPEIPRKSKPAERLSQTLLRERYVYKDGHLYDRRNGRKASWIGDGSRRHHMVWISTIDGGYNYLQSRVIWMYHHANWPAKIVRVDGNSLNDRIENLRDITASEVLRKAWAKRPATQTTPPPVTLKGGVIDRGSDWLVVRVDANDNWQQVSHHPDVQSALAAYREI